MDSLEALIDKASLLCGSQNALATYLGETSSNISKVRHGKRPMPAHQIERLAKLLDMEAADVWLIAQDARNPFKASAPGALASLLAACLIGVLSLAPVEKSFAGSTSYSDQKLTARTLYRQASTPIDRTEGVQPQQRVIDAGRRQGLWPVAWVTCVAVPPGVTG